MAKKVNRSNVTEIVKPGDIIRWRHPKYTRGGKCVKGMYYAVVDGVQGNPYIVIYVSVFASKGIVTKGVYIYKHTTPYTLHGYQIDRNDVEKIEELPQEIIEAKLRERR